LKLFDFDKLVASLTGFIETKVEIIKLDVEEEVKKVVAKAVIFVFIGIGAGLALFFLSMGLATLLNTLLGKPYIGYGIVAGIYLLLAIIGYLKRDSIYLSILQNLNVHNEEGDDEEQK